MLMKERPLLSLYKEIVATLDYLLSEWQKWNEWISEELYYERLKLVDHWFIEEEKKMSFE